MRNDTHGRPGQLYFSICVTLIKASRTAGQLDPDSSLIQVVLIRSMHRGQTDDQGTDWYRHADAHARVQTHTFARKDAFLDMHVKLCMHRLQARLSWRIPSARSCHLPRSNANCSHPGHHQSGRMSCCTVSGQIHFGGLHGIVLQVCTA